MISSRKGKRAPPAIVTGSARAAASETTPRIPIHETSRICGHGGMGSRRRNAGLRSRGITVMRGTQTSRTPMAAALMRAPCQSKVRGEPGSPASRIAPS